MLICIHAAVYMNQQFLLLLWLSKYVHNMMCLSEELVYTFSKLLTFLTVVKLCT